MKSTVKLSSQFILGILFIIYVLYVGIINPKAFFSIATLYDMLRSSSVYGILALGFLPILISGGIDMSFAAVSAFSTYVAVFIVIESGFSEAPLIVYYLLAIIIGGLLGFVNGSVIAFLKVPVMIVTLGTSAMITGFMLFKFGSTIIFSLPTALAEFSRMGWGTVVVNGSSTSFHPAVFIWIFLSIILIIFLKYTIIGRNIYAMGGDMSVFERSGSSRAQLEVIMFSLSGIFAAIAGVTYAALYRIVNPAMFIGQELDVIAMVVLGGASITGGKGTVVGTVVGILFINLLKNSLILINIPSIWQVFVVGILLFFGVLLPIMYEKFVSKEL